MIRVSMDMGFLLPREEHDTCHDATRDRLPGEKPMTRSARGFRATLLAERSCPRELSFLLEPARHPRAST